MFRNVVLLVLGGCLVACSSGEPMVERSWEEFVPGEREEETLGEEREVQALTNGKFFPGDCEWQILARVVDGDTIVLEDDTRVRFIGVDTPELKHPTKKVQPLAAEASSLTKSLLEPQEKVCLIDSTVGDAYDRYGRRLAYVFSAHGVDVNLELLRQGLAKGLFRFPFDRKETFKRVEKQAKGLRRGVWK